jgi:hypothetical protein
MASMMAFTLASLASPRWISRFLLKLPLAAVLVKVLPLKAKDWMVPSLTRPSACRQNYW